MSWRKGSEMFWEFWPTIQKAIPDPELRSEFTSELLALFLKNDTDPGDLLHRDDEIDRLMSEVDPERSIDDLR